MVNNKTPIGESQQESDNKSGFCQRLNDRMLELNIKQVDLMRKSGINKSSIGYYVQGLKKPNAEGAIALSKALNLNPEFLILGTGPKEPETIIGGRSYTVGEPSSFKIKGAETFDAKPASWRVALPMVDLTTHSGAAGELDQIIEDYFIDSRILSDIGREGIDGLCVGSITSDAMSPTIPTGSAVIVDLKDKSIREGVFVFKHGDYLQTKRLRPHGKSGAEIISDNPKYQPQVVDNAKDLIILGRVLKAIISI